MRIKLPRLKQRMKYGILLVTACLMVFSQFVSAQTADPDIATSSAQGVFWKLEKAGETAGYLLGTIHSEDPRVLDFSAEFLSQLNSCDVYAMEMVPDAATMHKLTGYMNFQDGKTLESVIGEDRFKLLVDAMSGFHLPPDFMTHMKPWAAMMTLSTPPPETGFFMDLSLSLRASGNSIDVVGLETLEQQLSFLEDMPEAMQINLLDHAIAEVGRVEEMQSGMVDAYLLNNLQQLQSITNDEFLSVGEDASNYFRLHGIAERNQRMLASLLPILDTSKVFVAVGALHLPGDQGLLSLLRGSGYQLLAMPMPFRDLTPAITEP